MANSRKTKYPNALALLTGFVIVATASSQAAGELTQTGENAVQPAVFPPSGFLSGQPVVAVPRDSPTGDAANESSDPFARGTVILRFRTFAMRVPGQANDGNFDSAAWPPVFGQNPETGEVRPGVPSPSALNGTDRIVVAASPCKTDPSSGIVRVAWDITVALAVVLLVVLGCMVVFGILKKKRAPRKESGVTLVQV